MLLDQDFKMKVLHMRMMQKQYFRSRDKFYLIESKKIEKKIDDELKGVQELFDEQAVKQPAKLTEEAKRKIIDEFLNWQTIVRKETPGALDTDQVNVIKMFLFESE